MRKQSVYTLLPREEKDRNLLEEAKSQVGQIVRLGLYDEFEGDFKILKARKDKVFVEVVSIDRLFAPCTILYVGDRLWVEDWVV